MYETRDLELIIDARVPIIAVETPDERRMLDLISRFTIKRALTSFVWTETRALRPLSFLGAQISVAADLSNPEALLKYIFETPGPALYVLCDFHPHLKDAPKVIRYLKDIALEYETLQNTVIFVSHALATPPEIARLTASFQLSLPSDAELMAIVREVAHEWTQHHPQHKVKTDDKTLQALITNLRGLTHADARVLVRHAVFRDGAITDSDIPYVNKLKFQLLEGEGLLRYEHDTTNFTSIAGLDNLKRWLAERQPAFVAAATASNDDRPKGMLVLGVQGTGKSMAARAVAGQWSLPLLRLDFGALFNKFFGETERNVRNALQQADDMAPCVLWIDELEKGVATDNQDHATSQRVLSTLLTWMAERQSSVFIVATANDVSRLPPELIRKGRLDEIFFVDLPDAANRCAILELHLKKRGIRPEDFDLNALAGLSNGFTGAELEQAVVAARYRASASVAAGANKGEVTQMSLADALTETFPISVTMAEKITALREWAEGRTVPA